MPPTPDQRLSLLLRCLEQALAMRAARARLPWPLHLAILTCLRGIGASFAINAMITAMTGKRAKVLGKPSRIAFDAAAEAMGIKGADRRRIVIFGDDPALEMRMAHNGRATGIGMTTGIMAADTVDTLRPAERPHAVIASLEPLADLLRG